MDCLDDLLVRELSILMDAERRIADASPIFTTVVCAPELRELLERSAANARTNLGRLGEVFSLLKQTPVNIGCLGICGLIEEGHALAKEDALGCVRDAGILVSAQQFEHYRIAGYGSVRTWADLLAHGRAARLLEACLDEAKDMDGQLTDVAETVINIEAEEAAEEV